MLALLSPAALWTLAALALPLAIHLWRPPPQTVRLGSLRFLDSLPHRRIKNLRWRERALLAARLALLAVLALLVAGPHWRKPPPAGPQRWALVDPSTAPLGESAERLRRLRAQGYQVHRLTPGLPLLEAIAPASASVPDLWARLREADAMLPAGSALAVFAPGRLATLHGARPALSHCRVEWIAVPETAGASWIESLRPGRAVVGTSGTAGTGFAPAGPVPTPGAPAVEFAPDGLRARLAGNAPGPWMAAAPAGPAARVLILHEPERADDARYVAAALQAAATATGKPLEVATRPLGGPAPSADADWVFWLGAAPVPAALADTAANLVTDAPVRPQDAPAPAPGWIVAPPGTPGAAVLDDVRLWRGGPASAGGTTLWTDARGQPLLTLTRTARGRRWSFGSRFHPDWNDLPRTAALAASLRDLLLPLPSVLPADPAHDLRLADPSQYQTSLLPADPALRPPAPAARPDAADLHWPLWLLAVALFAAERLLGRKPLRGSFNPPAIQPVATSAR